MTEKRHEATAPAKLRRTHPWRSFVEHPPKNERTEYNHPALPAKMNRPI